jgi:hypothetical protein
MSTKAARRVACETVAVYHERELAALIERVGVDLDRFRDGKLDAFGADQSFFQYSRAAKELWKFCNFGEPEITAAVIQEQGVVDWWERGAFRTR